MDGSLENLLIFTASPYIGVISSITVTKYLGHDYFQIKDPF